MADQASRSESQIRAELNRFGQQQVLTFWEDLNASERRDLVSQVAAIDLEQIRRLYQSWREGGDEDWARHARQAGPPRAIRRGPRGPAEKTSDALDISSQDAQECGAAA